MEFGEETIIGRIISRKHLVMQFPELLFHFPLLVMRHILKNRIQPGGTHWFITDCKQHLWARHKYRMGRPCSISCGPIRHQSPDWRQHKKTVSRRGRKVTICKSALPLITTWPSSEGARLLETDAKQSREPAFAHSHASYRFIQTNSVKIS